MERTKDVVAQVLDACPETRSDNRLLLVRVWERFGLQLTPEQWQMLRSLPQPETIRRSRAHMQNEEGRYLP